MTLNMVHRKLIKLFPFVPVSGGIFCENSELRDGKRIFNV